MLLMSMPSWCISYSGDISRSRCTCFTESWTAQSISSLVVNRPAPRTTKKAAPKHHGARLLRFSHCLITRTISQRSCDPAARLAGWSWLG
jgi:hypothetical protein